MEGKGTLYWIMGVSGSGKTTLGRELALQLGLPFFDGDDFHPRENIEKMSRGIPLDDTDREGWLRRLNALAREHGKTGAVIACSALKERYRKLLAHGLGGAEVWVYLHGSFQEIEERLRGRQGHFMPPALLESQFETLEPPAYGIRIPVSLSVEEAVRRIRQERP